MLPPNTCLQCTIFDQQNIHIKLLQSSLFLSPRNQYCMNVHCSRSWGITFSCQALALLCEHSLAWEAWCGPCAVPVLATVPTGAQSRGHWTGMGTAFGSRKGTHTDPEQSSPQSVSLSLVTVQCPVCTHCPHSPALTCQFPGQPEAPQHLPTPLNVPGWASPVPCRGWVLSLSPSLSQQLRHPDF